MICRRIISNVWFQLSPSKKHGLDAAAYATFNFYNTITHQIRHFSGKPRFDFGGVRKPDDAVALFRYMLRSQPPPSIFDFTKLLSSVVKIKQYDVALYLLDEMFHRRVPVDQYTLSIAVNCFCSLKRVDFAFAILAAFLKRGYEPDVVVFNKLIDGLLLVGKVSEAEKLFKKLLSLKLWEPDEVTYLTVINGLCKAGHTPRALDILSSWENEKCKPNIFAYNAVIDGLWKDKMVDGALHIFSTLADKGVSPDVVTFNSMISGLCSDNKLGKAIDLFNELGAKGVQPSVVTYNIIIGALCEQGNTEEAKDMLKQMVKNGLSPNSGTFNVVIRGLVKTKRMEDVIPILEEMERIMLDPTNLEM